MEWLKKLRDQFLNLWRGFETQTKILLGTVLFAVIIGLIFLASWAGKPQYVTLYSDLNDKDASTIVTWLKESKIPYKLDDNGTTVMVPQDQKYQARIDLAGGGLSPKGGSVGFEIFDQTKLGATDKERQIQYTRAVAGEMERSIELIDGIEFARVSISLPEESLFVEEDKPATASVLLKLGSMTRLSQQNVAAITHLVAGGVEGLDPNNVTVVDTAGNILNQASRGEEDFGQLASTHFQAQTQYETKLKNALGQMLGKVFGMNNVVVNVSTQMNFDKKEIVEKTYQPIVGDEGVVRSKETNKEETSGNGTNGATGVPGTDSNIPQYQGESQNTSSNSYNTNKEQNTVNYELNQREIQQIVAPGKIENLSVAVVINKQLDDTQVTNLKNFVASAIGYNSTRGDQLTIMGMPFDNSLEKEYQDAIKARKDSENQKLIYYGVAGLIGAILLFIIFRRTRKKDIGQVDERLDILIGEPIDEVAAAISHELSPEEKAKRELRKELADLISNKPDDVAQLLKTWLAED